MGIYFLRTIVPRKYMPIIFAVGLFCCDKFEETPNEKVSNMSKLSKSYFRYDEQISIAELINKYLLTKAIMQRASEPLKTCTSFSLVFLNKFYSFRYID